MLISVRSLFTHRKQLTYDFTSASFFDTGGSNTAKIRKYTNAVPPYDRYAREFSPKCLARQYLNVRMVCANMCIFSKFTSPSTCVLLPSCVNFMSETHRTR